MRRRNGGAQPPARGASAASRIGHSEWRRVARAPGEGEGTAGASPRGARSIPRGQCGSRAGGGGGGQGIGRWSLGQPQAMLEVELWATACNVRGGARECLG
jgi:hypothetical protein